MAQPHVHYEAAFEDYMRSRGWPYLPVNEHRRAIFGGERVKSFDYLVHRPGRAPWLVDVKGRKFPYDVAGSKRYWENWVTRGDIDDLARWEGVFGDGSLPVFVFAYWLLGLASRDPVPRAHAFRGEYYAFLWIPAAQYGRHARQRSPKWDTVTLPNREFRRLVRPIQDG